MKSYRKELHFHLPARRGLVNITSQVRQALEESGIQEGLLLVNAMNITASVFINDDESGLHHDYEVWLESWLPKSHTASTGITAMKITPTPISSAPSWAGGGGGRHRRTAGFRHLGANFLLRI